MAQLELKWNNEREDLSNKLFTTEKQLAFYMEEAKKTLTDKTQRARDNALPSSELTRQLEKTRNDLQAERAARQQALEELEAFKMRTAQMWQLQQDSVKAQLDEAKEGAAGAASELRMQLQQSQRELAERDAAATAALALLETELESLRAQGLEAQVQQLAGERAEWEHRLQEAAETHRVAMETLRAEHESMLTGVQAEFTAERTTLSTELGSQRALFDKLQAKHTELVSSLESEKSSRGRLDEEHTTAKATIDRLAMELKVCARSRAWVYVCACVCDEYVGASGA